MAFQHTWRCPMCGKDETHEAGPKDPVPIKHEHPMFDQTRKEMVTVEAHLEWVPPEGWVQVERLGWIPDPDATP